MRVSDSLLLGVLGSRSYASHCFEYPTLFRLLFVDRNTSAANCRSTTNYRKLGSSFLTFSFHYFANGSGSGWSHFLQFICHGQLANISKATLAQNQSLIHTQGRIPSLVSRPASSLSSNQNIFSHLQNSFLLPKPNSKQNSSPSQSKTSYSPSHILHGIPTTPLLPMLHFALFPRKEAANAEKVQS